MSKDATQKCLRGLVLVTLVLCLVVPGMAKKKMVESAWSGEPVSVDGASNDWQNVKLVEVDKQKVKYGFKNDGNYLYSIFIFTDFKFLSTINSSGMTLWLNADGKKKKQYGIKFMRKMITPEHFIALLERQHGPLPEEKKLEIKKKKFYTIYQNGVVDKKSETAVPFKVASDQAPAFKLAQSPQEMIYEFRIPLANEEGKVVGLGTTPGSDISVCFEWGGKTKEWQAMVLKKRGYRGSANHGGVSGSMPGSDESGSIGGGMSSGGSTRTQFAHSSTPPKYSIWAPIKLAEEKK